LQDYWIKKLILPTGTPVTIDFDATVSGVNNGQFAGAGFTATPGSGEIDSDGIIVTGLSDGDMSFGGTYTSGDYARGISSGGISTGGIYSFNVGDGFSPNYTLGFQPSTNDLIPGEIILIITNTTGVAATSIKIDYSIWELNNSTGDRSTSIDFSYSSDDISYTDVTSLNFSSGTSSDFVPAWKSPTSTHAKNFIIDLTSSPLANGSSFYLKWTSDDFSGTVGDRDELALDDIAVTINPAKDNDSDAEVFASFQEPSGTISSLVTTSSGARSVFYFQISDKGTSDGLPTKVEKMRFIPNTTNVSWVSQIQGVVISDGGTDYTQQSIDINDSYIDITFADGVLTVLNGTDLPLRLEVYLNTSGIIDGGNLDFRIDASSHGFTSYSSGSGFATTFPADVISNQFTIDVSGTELRFVQQPVDTETNVQMAVDVSVEATDANGNRALNFTGNVSLSSSSGTLTGDPITVTAVEGLATWAQATNPIVHTIASTAPPESLTASSGALTSAISGPFTIIQAVDRLAYGSIPTQGQVNQNLATIIVNALKPDLTIDTNFSGDITLSKASGTGNISGTLTQVAVNGVATFSDIQFDATGSYTILAASEPYITTVTSETIQIGNFNEDFSTCPAPGWLAVTINGNAWSCGSGYGSVNGIGGSAASDSWYITPQIDLSIISNAVLSFDSWSSGTDDTHPKLEVKYSLDYSGTGNPYLATWTDLVFSPPTENSQEWLPSGLIDLSTISAPVYIAFRYSSSGTAAGSATEWRIDNVQISDQGCASPTSPASNLTFTDIQSNQMTLNWDNGNGTGRLVLAKAGSAVNQIPVDGTNYAANSDFTAGQDIGGGNIVVFKGTESTVTVTNLTANATYHYAVYEYNCDDTNPTFNPVAPATGSQATNASDIITNGSFPYPVNIAYENYQALSPSMTTSNSIGVFGMILRDGGATAPADGQPTILDSIKFSANGSRAIRAAAIYDGATLLSPVNVNGSTEFTIDLTGNPITAADQGVFNFELWVTFMDGSNVVDNDQIVYTVTGAYARTTGSTVFISEDAGGAESIQAPAGTGTENVLIVNATVLNFVQVPQTTIPINQDFTIEVEAIDARGTRDLDVSLTASIFAGTGVLSSVSGLTQSTAAGTALWSDLNYDTEETGVIIQIDDGGSLTIQTNPLSAKSSLSIFTFTGASGDETNFPPDTQPVNITIGNIERGSNLLPQTFADAFNARNWTLLSTPQNEFFYQFTIDAEPGYAFDITSIELDHRRSGTGPVSWVVRSSVDGYITDIGGFFSTPTEDIWFTNQEVNFGAAVQGETSATIRIYAYNATGGLGTWAIDNLAIFGTVQDIQAPEFTTGYPQSDSTAVDGFDLLVNLSEAATVYYVAQDPAVVSAAPDLNQVINGLNGDDIAAEAADTITVTAASTDFYERVTGLTSDNIYDVYYVLYDSTFYSAVIPQTGLLTSDTDTDLASAAQPGGPNEIPSTATDAASAVNVFNFQISDAGTADGVPTHVTKLVFNAGGNNTVADWSTVIGGATLFNTTQGASVAISNVTINPASLEIDINPGDLMIADASSDELALSIWLTTSVIDNEELELTIGGNPHTNTTYRVGSQFSSSLTALNSNIYTITVTSDRLNITFFTPSINNINQNIDLEVEATDVNLNRDLDEVSEVVVTLGQGLGAISANGAPPLNQNLVGGFISWNNIRYDTDDEIITLITTSTTLQDDTTGTIIVGSPQDLIVNGNFLLSSDLTVRNVIINDGGTLTITSGVRLEVSGDYTFNDSGTLVDQGATTVFNGGANTTQTITKIPAGASERFYNIEVDQGNNAELYNEMSIELLNSLIMTDGDFYIAGEGNDQDFTLVSTASNTARIAEMADGTSIIGDVIWQRSLRTGPEGFRYIGTPMKNQNLGSISDDVWIQGIAESFPGAYTNIATYFEPVGTEGQDGFEGWQDFSSNSDALNVGEGMKLYLWGVDYATEQVISQKGEPFIAGGDDGVAGSGESVTFIADFTSTAYDGGGWNFFANPYPSEIDWDFVSYNAIDGEAVHVWNPVLQNYGTYSPSTGAGTNGVSQYIASGQGFFIRAQDATGSITFSESSKSLEDGNSFLREGDELLTKLKVEINASDGSKDEAAIIFTDFATDGYDPQFDAKKLSAGWVNISSVLDNNNIVINAMGEKRGVQRIQLNIEPYVYGSFTMKFPDMESFAEGATAKLVDHFMDKTKYINSSSSYVFDIEENNPDTYGPDRFEIQFVEPANFRFDQPNAKAGQEFVIPVFADKLEDVLDAYMTLSWDHEALAFVGIEDTGLGDISNFDLSEVENGRLIYTDEQQDPLSLPDGTQLFSIRFEARNGQSQAELRFEKANMRLKAIEDIDMPFSAEDVLIDILQNRFVSGAISTYGGTSINEVLVKAQAVDETIENISDLSGVYQLGTYEQSNYTVSANKTDADPLSNAVTTLDIIQSRSHILGKEEFMNPYQWIAADVNGSQSITAIDLVEMRKVILGINTAFESGLNWLFIPDTYDLSNDPFGYQTSVDIALNEQDLDLNFVGVKVGDVDNSWTNEGGARKSNLDFALRMENMTLQDNLVEIPVVVDAYSDIRGYQFSVTWDPNELEYFGVSSDILEGFFNEQMVEQGILTTLWDDLDGEPRALQEGDVLMTLKFRARHETATSEVDINSTVTEAIAFDGNLNAMSINSTPARVNLEELRNGQLELFQNIPNPFEFSTTIDFRVPKPGLVRFSIVNTLGEIVYIHEDNYKAGIYSLDWDRSQGSQSIAPGVYLYRLESNGAEVVKKMMIK
jgi:hypothetical protein